MEFEFSNGYTGIVIIGEPYVYASCPDEQFILENVTKLGARLKSLKTGKIKCVTDNIFTTHLVLAKPQLKLEL